MLAAVKTHVKEEIELQSVDVPELNDDELLIKVEYCGVCGSDLHAYKHSKGYEFVDKPIILGHEFSGEVVQAGQSQHPLLNQKVVAESMNYCGACQACREERFSICENIQVIGLHFNGGFAEYVKVNQKYVRPIQSSLDTALAALSEPMTIALHAVHTVSQVSKGDTVLVQGPGIIGFFTAIACKEQGAEVYLSGLPSDYEHRLSKCELFGIKPHIVGETTLGENVDYVFECSGSPQALASSFNHLKKGGTAVVVALYEHSLDLFMTPLVRKEIKILTSYGSNPEEYDLALKILQKHQSTIGELIKIYPLQEISRAFTDASEQKVLKAVIKM